MENNTEGTASTQTKARQPKGSVECVVCWFTNTLPPLGNLLHSPATTRGKLEKHEKGTTSTKYTTAGQPEGSVVCGVELYEYIAPWATCYTAHQPLEAKRK